MKRLVEPMQVQITEQRRNHSALGSPLAGTIPLSRLTLAFRLYYRALQPHPEGCGSFVFEARALSVNRIAGVRSVHGARMRGDIDTPAGYLAGVRRYEPALG